MLFGKKIQRVLFLPVLLSCFWISEARSESNEQDLSRVPAASVKHSKKKTKKASESKAKKQKHKAKSKKHHAKGNRKSPSKNAPASHYPTQPGGSGFGDIPNDKKDNLPPPTTSPNQ